MNIWIIRFENEFGQDVDGLARSVRVAAASQLDAEAVADRILNDLLTRRPGVVGTWSVSRWFAPRED